jgi:hypothetical protein
MTREDISTVLLSAPAWARLGLTVRDERMRERAADVLAATILERLQHPISRPDPDQMLLMF